MKNEKLYTERRRIIQALNKGEKVGFAKSEQLTGYYQAVPESRKTKIFGYECFSVVKVANSIGGVTIMPTIEAIKIIKGMLKKRTKFEVKPLNYDVPKYSYSQAVAKVYNPKSEYVSMYLDGRRVTNTATKEEKMSNNWYVL